MLLILTIISAALFIFYGLLCITTQHMVKEFERYGVAKFRDLVGYLELLGGLGQIVGYFYSFPLYVFASTGLTLLMLMAVVLRVKLKDPLIQIIPAAGLLLINAFLVLRAVENLF